MSHEIFAIETQRELYGSVSMCVWVAGFVHARACVCVCVFILTLALKAAGSTSRSGRQPTCVRSDFCDPKNNLAGTKSNWLLRNANLLAAAQLTSQGERMFDGDLSQKSQKKFHQMKAQC